MLKDMANYVHGETPITDGTNSFTVAISATVFVDYDIGLDIWTIIVTVILAVISVWFIVTIKCIPKFGKKIYKCCPSLFEIEDTERVL